MSRPTLIYYHKLVEKSMADINKDHEDILPVVVCFQENYTRLRTRVSSTHARAIHFVEAASF